jgi:D-tyrosyl-tRNA(Tyr) deacylase
MKLVVQNVESASVKVINDDWSIKKQEKINKGVLIYFWVSKKTTNLEFNIVKNSLDKFVDKFPRMRRLKNKDGRLDATLDDVNWEILVVSNFTLYASNKNWTKMDFSASWEYGKAEKIYEYFVDKLKEKFVVKTWEFGAMMEVESINDGPVNYVMEI